MTGKRSGSPVLRVGACVRSHASSAGHHRRSAGNCVTARRVAGIGPLRRSRPRGSARHGRATANSSPMIVCGRRCRLGSAPTTARSRSVSGCDASSPTIRRCGCHTKPFTRPCTSRVAGWCAGSCRQRCGLGGRSVSPTAGPRPERASVTW